MALSLFLAKAMGLYFLIVSLAALINLTNFVAAIDDLLHNPSSHLTISLITLILGILTVLTHNVWVSSWVVIITIIAWIMLLKGVLNLLLPNAALAMADFFINSRMAWILGLLVDLVLGIVLCYFGFSSAS